jgi:hypothetical protein
LCGLVAGAAPKALANAVVPVLGRVCFDEAIVMATIAVVAAEGGVCPSVASSRTIDGSSVTESVSCPFTISSPIASLTFCLACLGFGELELKIQEWEKNPVKIVMRKQPKTLVRSRKSAHLGVSSSVPPREALALCFLVAALGPLG